MNDADAAREATVRTVFQAVQVDRYSLQVPAPCVLSGLTAFSFSLSGIVEDDGHEQEADEVEQGAGKKIEGGGPGPIDECDDRQGETDNAGAEEGGKEHRIQDRDNDGLHGRNTLGRRNAPKGRHDEG
jgi:hypothetical protein